MVHIENGTCIQALRDKWLFLNCTYVIHVALEVTRQTVLDERTDHQGAVAVADGSWQQTFTITVLKVHTCVFVDGATLYGLLIFLTFYIIATFTCFSLKQSLT